MLNRCHCGAQLAIVVVKRPRSMIFGVIYELLGDYQEALDAFARALATHRAIGDRGGEAITLINLGGTYSALGEHQKAFEYYSAALALHIAAGDRESEATALHNIGASYHELGDNDSALTYYAQALQLRRAVGDRRGEGNTLSEMGSAYRALRNNQKALVSGFPTEDVPCAARYYAVGSRAHTVCPARRPVCAQ
jgi:tetratricopeptide (TPR) repeat protein